MSLSDPIVDEIHAIREAMAKASDNDLRKIAEAAIAQMKSLPPQKPFFLAVGFRLPHVPYCGSSRSQDIAAYVTAGWASRQAHRTPAILLHMVFSFVCE